MCSPLAAVSPAAALMKSKPGLATAMISPAAAILTARKKRDKQPSDKKTGNA